MKVNWKKMGISTLVLGLCVVASPLVNKQPKLHSLNISVTGKLDMTEHVRGLHVQYDQEFKKDGTWATANHGDYEVGEINFFRWLIKNGHGRELVPDEFFDSKSTQYQAVIDTWHELLRTGEYTTTPASGLDRNYIESVTSGIHNAKDMKPLEWSSDLQDYVKKAGEYVNPITHSSMQNRVNLAIHKPSLETDAIRKASGSDAVYAENLIGGGNLTFDRHVFSYDEQLIAFLVDDNNITPSEEAGHRWGLLSNNDYAASYRTKEGGTIINFGKKGEIFNSADSDHFDEVQKQMLAFYNQHPTVGANAVASGSAIYTYYTQAKVEHPELYKPVGFEVIHQGVDKHVGDIVTFGNKNYKILEDSSTIPFISWGASASVVKRNDVKCIRVEEVKSPSQTNVVSTSHEVPTTAKDANFADGIDSTQTEGLVRVNGDWYFYKNYVKQSGLQTTSDNKSFFFSQTDKTLQSGFQDVGNGKKAYFDTKTGEMQKGWRRIDQKWYWLGNDGLGLTTTQHSSWVKVNDHGVNKYMYRQSDGSFATNESVSINGKIYHFDDGGYSN